MQRRFFGLGVIILGAMLLFVGCARKDPPPENINITPAATPSPSIQQDPPDGLIHLKANPGHGALVLVSNAQKWNFPNVQLTQLFGNKPACYSLRAADLLLQPEALTALNAMLSDYYAATGDGTVNVVAGWRDADTQQNLYDQAVQNRGEAHAKAFIAQTGGSEHHTGLAVDLSVWHAERGTSEDFTKSGDRVWVYENCANYGFILRYPEGKEQITGISSESWHFRYVGIPHAEIIMHEGLVLEEYLARLRTYRADGEHYTFGNYEIWYCEEGAVYVPASGEYTLSSDNMGGYIVTWTKAQMPA